MRIGNTMIFYKLRMLKFCLYCVRRGFTIDYGSQFSVDNLLLLLITLECLLKAITVVYSLFTIRNMIEGYPGKKLPYIPGNCLSGGKMVTRNFG